MDRCVSLNCLAGGDGQAERRYGLAPIGRFLVEDAAGSLVTLLQLSQTTAMLSMWGHLDAAILDDTLSPFARSQGGISLWDYSQSNREFGNLLHKGMADYSRLYLGAILEVTAILLNYQYFNTVARSRTGVLNHNLIHSCPRFWAWNLVDICEDICYISGHQKSRIKPI